MPDDYRISDLSTAPSIGNSDLMELSVVNTASETGYTSMKAPVLNLANKIVNATQYVSDLQTQNKTITGAINEIAQGGGGGGGDADIVKTASGSIASFTTNLEAKLPALKANFLCSGGNGTPSTPIPLVPYTELNVINVSDTDLANALKNVYEGKYGFVDLGSLTWSYSSSLKLFYAPLTPYPKGDGGCITNGYERIDGYTLATDLTKDKKMAMGWLVDDKCINIRDLDYTDTNDFKTHVSGKYLLYELATETTPSITETDFNNIVSSFNANGDLITIDLDGTRYGGYVDANNGKLVVTHGIVDLGTLTWIAAITNVTGKVRMRAALTHKAVPNSVVFNAKCDIYTAITASETYTCVDGISGENTGSYIFVYDSNYSTTADLPAFETMVNGHYLAYELATPIEVDISPEYLNAHQGVNNVFHDGNGDVELSYFTDLAGDIKDFIHADVGLDDLDDVVITSPSANQVLKYDGNKWVNGTGGGGGVPWVEITGTLLAGNVILLWTVNPNIHADSTVDIYVDTAFYGVAPLTVSLSEGSLTLTFEPQSADMPVKVRLS